MPDIHKLFFLDGSTEDVAAMRAILETAGLEFIYEEGSTETDFIKAVKNFEPDIILAEHLLASYSASEAFKCLSADKNRPGFIVVAKNLGDDIALELCKEGVDDAISKTNYKALPASVMKALDKRKTEVQQNEIAIDIVKRNKELESFAYMISHNLGGSVANIKGLFDIWDPDKRTSHEQKYIYAGLKFSIQKLDEVIKDINVILKMKGQTKENKETVMFETLVKDIKYSHLTLIRNTRTRIKTNFKAAESMLTNKSYLNSIFYNLISNSIKYRRDDIPPQITISSKIKDGHLELLFKDNGIGIDLELHGAKVFGLYKRFNDTQEGKGMGLFLVKSQVEALSGTIDVWSEVNKGCEFLIRFPLK